MAPHLYTHLWKSQARADELDKHPLVGLTTAIPSGHLANAVDVWVAEVALARDRVAEAHSAQRAAEARSQRLQSETETREGRLRDADAKIEMLEQHRSEVEQELARERKVRADGQAHASADYEQLRAKSVKRMKKQSELLEEGLHALRREPPVVEVGLDRMERTLDRLHADLQDLRGKDRQ